MAKDTYYFPHDYNARTDSKIKDLIMRHSMLGYGLYWAIVEDLYNNANALPTHYERIAFDMRVGIDVVKSVINDFELFAVGDKTFSSNSVQRRLDERNEKSLRAQFSAKKRWNDDANALPTHSDRNAIKERKRKEKKVIPPIGGVGDKPFIPPTLPDFCNYFSENGYMREIGERAWSGYNVAGWKDSRDKPVKNWKQKCQNVWFRPEHKIIEKKMVL